MTPSKPIFNTHKVFAAIGIILTMVIIILAALWYYTGMGADVEENEDTVKVTTSSAKPASKSASPSAN